MQRDRQIVVVPPPQFLEHDLGLRARVDEDDGGAVAANRVIDRGQREDRHVARPRQLRHVHDRDLRLGARLARDPPDLDPARAEPELQRIGKGRRRRKPDAARAGRKFFEPRKPQRQKIAALRPGKRMHLVDDDGGEAREHARRFGI